MKKYFPSFSHATYMTDRLHLKLYNALTDKYTVAYKGHIDFLVAS